MQFPVDAENRSGLAAGRVQGTVATCLLALGLTTGAVAQTTYTLTDLGTLPGCTSVTPNNLNDNGNVVGFCSGLGANSVGGFVWRNGVMTATGKLPQGTYSVATAINASGKYVGDGDSKSAAMLGWVSTASGLYNFFSNNGGFTRPMYIADNGAIGGRYTSSNGGWIASGKGVIWIPEAKDPRKYRKNILPILPGGIDPTLSYAFPNAFNQSGQAAGYATTDQIGQHAVMWKNDAARTIVDLGTVIDGHLAAATGMNDAGEIVGEVTAGASTQPAMWHNDVAHTSQLLPLLPGDDTGTTVDINNAGVIIGSSAKYDVQNNIAPVRPVVWEGGFPVELQVWLDPATGFGYTLTETRGINNAGQIIATALRNGLTRAVLLTPLP